LKEKGDIRKHNIKAHTDIEMDIMKKQDGQMTFTLRINGGNIVDYNLVEYINVRQKYGDVSRLVVEKPSFSCDDGKRG